MIHWILGVALMLLGWLLPRRAAETRWQRSAALPMDLLLPLGLFAVVLALTARPLLAGVVTLAAGAGWARADRDKRRVLAEPIVFTDVFQALDIARHPQLAMPFPHKAPLVLAALGTIAFFTLVTYFEPPAWHRRPWLPLAFVAAAVLVIRAGRKLLPIWYQGFRQQQLTADPALDGMHHGPLATLLLYGLFAHHERAARRARLTPPAASAPASSASKARDAGPVVLVQSESFFDARRLHPGIPATLLPHFGRACQASVQWGRFAVPSWGANTVRTEFAVLTGLDPQAIGFDRFNPYYRFADEPIQSLAWQLKREGYRTVCLHPFDRHFYRRDQVMPNLGFDEFLGEELFEGAQRINGYVSDIEVAEVARRLIRERGPKIFLLVITMENHGPWSGAPDRQIAELAGLPLDDGERLGLNHYLASLVHADTLFGMLRAELEAQAAPAVLGFYGDHLPSFPTIFPKLGLDTAHSDYLIWRSAGGFGQEQELPAEHLAAALMAARN
ncbi:MAG: LTA synthase family protein [Pseudomonadota bacterium]